MDDAKLQYAIAQAIVESYWRMVGGDGPSGGPPDAGDLQLAFDIMCIPEMQELANTHCSRCYM